MSSRAIAVSILDTLNKGKSNLSYQLQVHQDHKDISFIRALCYGCCRWQLKFESLLDTLLDKPIKQKDSDIKQLLLLGLYEIEYMNTPEHAVVSEIVSVCKKINKQWAKGFVNAILRNYLRKKNQLLSNFKQDDQFTYAHPTWYIEKIQIDWPNAWQAILNANNQQAPMTLRVNLAYNSQEEYLNKLKHQNIDAKICQYSPAGIILNSALNVVELPEFQQGAVSIQDEAAQLAAEILVTNPNSKVLDACAAPGGKTAHLLEKNAYIHLTALDKKTKRLNDLKHNLKRLNFNVETKVTDATDIKSWANSKCFDHILLDAPCSASGIIRRQPDIKIHRSSKDVEKIVITQAALLRSLWQVLKPNGTLLYATCSIFKQENCTQIKEFLSQTPNAELQTINISEAIDTGFGTQILPNNKVGMDGFFYALLKKTA